MTDKQTQQQAPHSNMEKPPENWVTGDEPMTGAQRSYLKTLSEEAHVPFEDGLTKAQASQRIDELQALTGRGEHARMAAEQREENRGDKPEERPQEPPDGPLESLGRAVSDPVLGSQVPGQSGGLAPDAPSRPGL